MASWLFPWAWACQPLRDVTGFTGNTLVRSMFHLTCRLTWVLRCCQLPPKRTDRAGTLRLFHSVWEIALLSGILMIAGGLQACYCHPNHSDTPSAWDLALGEIIMALQSEKCSFEAVLGFSVRVHFLIFGDSHAVGE